MKPRWRELGWSMVIVGVVLAAASLVMDAPISIPISLGIAVAGVAAVVYGSRRE